MMVVVGIEGCQKALREGAAEAVDVAAVAKATQTAASLAMAMVVAPEVATVESAAVVTKVAEARATTEAARASVSEWVVPATACGAVE